MFKGVYPSVVYVSRSYKVGNDGSVASAYLIFGYATFVEDGAREGSKTRGLTRRSVAMALVASICLFVAAG